jgi:hemoglobin-like flavoprotein
MPRLERLVLDDNGLGPISAEALAASPLASHLHSLSLAHNRLGDPGAEVLSRGLRWHALRTVDLQSNGIGLGGAAAITSSSRMGLLQRLNLSHNALGTVLDIYSLAQHKIPLMEESFTRFKAMGADFAERFYQELFARFPGVKPLFANVSMLRQRGHLMSALVLVIDHLRTPEIIEQQISDMGARHIRYGAAPSHYYAVTSTLLETMRALYGEGWSDEIEGAWSDGLEAVANIMMRSAAATADRPAVSQHETAPARPGGPR